MAPAQANVIHTPNMDTPSENDPITFGTVLKYLGTVLVAILIFVFGWLGRLISRILTQRVEAYVRRIEEAASRVESLSEKLDALTEADKNIIRRIEVLEREFLEIKRQMGKS